MPKEIFYQLSYAGEIILLMNNINGKTSTKHNYAKEKWNLLLSTCFLKDIPSYYVSMTHTLLIR